jgi:hypothetical protein
VFCHNRECKRWDLPSKCGICLDFRFCGGDTLFFNWGAIRSVVIEMGAIFFKRMSIRLGLVRRDQ